jgi:hypothetical protein
MGIFKNLGTYLTRNLKTVNGTSLIGTGDLVISAGSGDGNNTATATVASATNCLIFAQNSENIKISGTTAISSFGTSGLTAGQKKFVRFLGNVTLTNTANLDLGTVGTNVGTMNMRSGDLAVVYVESATLCSLVKVTSGLYVDKVNGTLSLTEFEAPLATNTVCLSQIQTVGSNSVLLGTNATDGNAGDAVAVGENAQAYASGSTAISLNSQTTRPGEVNFGRDAAYKLGMGMCSWQLNGTSIVSSSPTSTSVADWFIKANTLVNLDVIITVVKSGVTAGGASFRVNVTIGRGTTAASAVIIGTPVVDTLANSNPAIFFTPDPASGFIYIDPAYPYLRFLNQWAATGYRAHFAARITEVTV